MLQIVLTVSQMMWSKDITVILEGKEGTVQAGMEGYEKKCFEDLNKLAALVRGHLEHLEREVMCALITVDVHARDMVTDMVKHKVQQVSTQRHKVIQV